MTKLNKKGLNQGIGERYLREVREVLGKEVITEDVNDVIKKVTGIAKK